MLKFGCGCSNVDADQRPHQLLLGEGGVHEGLVRNLQNVALARVHALGFVDREAERLGVEEVPPLDEDAVLSVDLEVLPGLSVLVVVVLVLPAHHGDLPGHVRAVGQRGEGAVRVPGACKPAGHPTDRDGGPLDVGVVHGGLPLARELGGIVGRPVTANDLPLLEDLHAVVDPPHEVPRRRVQGVLVGPGVGALLVQGGLREPAGQHHRPVVRVVPLREGVRAEDDGGAGLRRHHVERRVLVPERLQLQVALPRAKAQEEHVPLVHEQG
mmetsp:Transcript_40274/g.125506  ORF Transcript_40274/g.125506 Transcript_40274/m.125506 type:complete len:269 (-) Transcript_40274:475-1281(-)